MENLTERRLYINTSLQKISGDDTEFQVQLNGTFLDVMKLQLNSITIDNYFLNMTDLSVQLENGDIITILVDQYLNRQNFIQYLNTFT